MAYINADAIEDNPLVDVTNDDYIRDLELEIDSLRKQIRLLEKKKPKAEPINEDKNCCKAYSILVKNFHNLLDDIIPF